MNQPLQSEFDTVSSKSETIKPSRKTKPIAIRFTENELSMLRQEAGKCPLSTYCREKLLGDRAQKRVKLRQPQLDEQQYAKLLAALGQSRMSSNLNQLAKSANMGTLDMSDDTQKQLEEAYSAILAMRDALTMALKIKIR